MKQELIVKSNKLLQHPLYKTSLELKLFSRIILEVRKNPNEDIITFQIKDLLEKLDCNKNDYAMIKKIADSMDRRVDINEDKENIFSDTVHIFRRITIDKQGVIVFKVEEDIKPYILNLTNNFTQYYFENIARLKSSYSIRIYEFLKQYENLGKRKISIIELRHFLNIEDGKYSLYTDFKRRTILVSQKEIKEKTDIYFEFKEIKTGRKITDIEFFIYKNKSKESTENKSYEELEEIKDEEKNIIYKKLISLGVKEKQALSLSESHTIERLNNNIRYVESEIKKGKDKNNLGGFIVSAIAGDFYNQTDLFKEDEIKDNVKKRINKDKKEKIKKQKSEKENTKKKDKKRKSIEKYLKSLSEKEVEKINLKFIEENKGNFVLRKHLQSGQMDLNNKTVRFNYYEFVFSNYLKK